MATWLVNFTVCGASHFPMDMLRYDHCWPKDSEDAVKISSNPDDRDFFHVKRTVHLQMEVNRRDGLPTAGRWKSFGWEVTAIEEPRKM